jgi:hypothetical protein
LPSILRAGANPPWEQLWGSLLALQRAGEISLGERALIGVPISGADWLFGSAGDLYFTTDSAVYHLRNNLLAEFWQGRYCVAGCRER